MAYAPSSDLLLRASAGDSIASATLARELLPHIQRQLARYPVATEDREDLVQTTVMQVLKRLPSFRGDSSFSTWLFRVTANEALMLMRSQRRHRSRLAPGFALEDLGGLDASRDDSAEDRMQNADVHRRLWSALGSLPPEYKDVVTMHYGGDLSLEEIAASLRTSESAVRSRLHRARTRLRQVLTAQGLGREPLLGAAA